MYGFLAFGAILLGGTLVVGAWLVSYASATEVAWPAMMSMLSIGLLGSVLGAQAVLRAQDRPMAFVVLSLISSVAANLAGLLAIMLWANATAYMAAYTVLVAVSAATALILVKPMAPWRVANMVRESVAIAAPLLPHTGALMLLTQGAVLLLAMVAGAASAGQYGAVLIFALGPLTLLNALNNAWATRLMGAPTEHLLPMLRSVAAEALMAGTAIGLLASAAASAGSIILTQAPDDLAPVARILPLMSVGYALFLVATNVVYILAKTKAMAYLTPLVLVLMGAIAFPFASRADLEAVAIIHAAGFTLLGLAYWMMIRTATPHAWPIRLFLILMLVHVAIVLLLGLLPTTLLVGAVEIAAVGVMVLFAAYVKFKRTARQPVSKRPAKSFLFRCC
ncbi:hypothetical protein ACW0JT_11830 [Arthrobacter sp. SA17]